MRLYGSHLNNDLNAIRLSLHTKSNSDHGSVKPISTIRYLQLIQAGCHCILKIHLQKK